ncbi:hypothetical protein AnigIFM56816_004361 [Aspergillus niger]|nr:hypothetical protein AnigIFM56816_004361 [Aspergillus niger]
MQRLRLILSSYLNLWKLPRARLHAALIDPKLATDMPDRSYRVYMGLEVLSTFTRPGGDADITDHEKTRDAVLQHYAEVQAAENCWRPWPLHRLDLDIIIDGHPSWTRVPEVTLLGDAAHLGATNGEGVEIAIGNHQADEDTAAVDRAIVAYEADTRAHR